jgi:hypothetical protein
MRSAPISVGCHARAVGHWWDKVEFIYVVLTGQRKYNHASALAFLYLLRSRHAPSDSASRVHQRLYQPGFVVQADIGIAEAPELSFHDEVAPIRRDRMLDAGHFK